MTAVPPRLVIATKNADKLREVAAVLARLLPDVELVTGVAWDDVEETGSTLVENALLKAYAVAEATDLPALADDTGLEVDALGGAPGVHTARYAGPEASYADNRRRLLAELEGVGDRRARFRTAVALVWPDGGVVTADGVLEGAITVVERGDGGFGYDPIFAVAGRTLAEIPETEKNAMSHRALALEALAARIHGAGTTGGDR